MTYISLSSLFLADIQIKYAVIGQNATISCSSTKPIPFVWSKDKANITEADKRYDQFVNDKISSFN